MSQENKPKPFQVGDTVTWTSQAGGRSKTKTGKIVKIVNGRNAVGGYIPEGFHLRDAPGFRTRDRESYLIQVGKSKRLYWPLVKYLEKVEQGIDDYSQHTPIPETDPEEWDSVSQMPDYR